MTFGRLSQPYGVASVLHPSLSSLSSLLTNHVWQNNGEMFFANGEVDFNRVRASTPETETFVGCNSAFTTITATLYTRDHTDSPNSGKFVRLGMEQRRMTTDREDVCRTGFDLQLVFYSEE